MRATLSALSVALLGLVSCVHISVETANRNSELPTSSIDSIEPTALDTNPEELDANLLDHQFNSLLKELDSLLTVPTSEEERVVYDTYTLVKNSFLDGRLKIIISEYAANGIFDTAVFVPNMTDGIPVIEINKYLIELSKHTPSIVLSILVHEVRHAYDYFTNREYYLRTYGNELEMYLYEMDAFYVEALFISEYLSSRGYELTLFEQLIAESQKKDGLNRVSIFFLGIDREVVYYLHMIGGKLANKEITLEEYMNSYLRVGELISNYPIEADDETEQYAYLIAKSTFNIFSNKLIGTALSNYSGDTVRSIEVDEFIDKVNSIISQNMMQLRSKEIFMNEFSSRYRAKYNIEKE